MNELLRKQPDAFQLEPIVHITHIFNASLRLSYFPLLQKFAYIILFPKVNKPPGIPFSHRSIGLLSFFAKILERLILKRILSIILEKNILPDTQFDFCASYSTIHQVHRVVNAISYSLEKKTLLQLYVFRHFTSL